MKKSIPYFALATGILFILAIGLQPVHVSGSKIGSAGSPSLPDSIMKIVQKSCMACHANDGNSMARMHINFDSWDSYGEKKWPSKAKDICNVLTKGKMPPKGFRDSNPDAVPTDKDVKTVCAWAESLQK
jgi:hypothetical protein